VAHGRRTEGSRLLASDIRNDNRVAAILAWHFEPGGSGGSQRPHLIIAAAIRKDVEDQALRAEYLIALWLLICVVVAIDRRTIKAGRVGLVLDGAIVLLRRRDRSWLQARPQARWLPRRLLHVDRVSAPDRFGLVRPSRR
jgi:hypothetical protein